MVKKVKKVKKKSTAGSGKASAASKTATTTKPVAESAAKKVARKTVKKAPAKKKAPPKQVASSSSAAAASPASEAAKASPAPKAATSKGITRRTVAAKQAEQAAPAKAVAAVGLRATAATNGTSKRPAASRSAGTGLNRPAVPYASLAPGNPASSSDSSGYDPRNHTPPSDDEMRKVKTGLTPKHLARFREILLERRAEIMGDVQGLEAARSGSAGELSHMPLHMADVGSDNYEQEFTLGLMESERRTLMEIDEALARIENKTYGVCIESAVPIGRPRLEAKPWAKYCIEVARERERRGLS